MQYTGASHIPIIQYGDKLCIVLFAEPTYEIYMDSGGHAEANETPVDTACREGKEESLNTFNIDNQQILNHVNHYNVTNLVLYKNYYAFFIKYNIDWNVIHEVYKNNRDIISSSTNVPKFWKESNNVTIFTIDSLVNGITRDGVYFTCTDIFGANKIVFKRPIKYILHAIDQRIFRKNETEWTIKGVPIKNVTIEKNITNDFLNNTLSIKSI
jgi:hypothetical protein